MNIARLDAHHKLYLSLIVALTVFVLCYGKMSASTQFILVWIGYAVTQLGLSWATIFIVHPLEMKKISKVQDNNRTLIFMFVLVAALMSLFVVVLLLKSTQHLTGSALTLHILLSIAAVMCAWALVHTIFVFRYAHLYYESKGKNLVKPATLGKEEDSSKYKEGLEFPEEKTPDYLDFTYFSFVIGMTFQVSDVEISSRRIRRLALMHSLVSFAFNTVIVALSINIISGLMTK
ncbi:putative membrane protein [Pedobacter cryoconitis]|uniref:Putative membrane protein n=1 Tax=Pedobacter cryoconitis TaxID=188932 RepID=A0A7W8YRM5_9SPHI|nr:DUF1345 domain-containing protein [Pedobacter cryoconitis]MBB5620509.1 putative membrane protein [Pedobacter cryoconitis]MBB5646419.1 putative membrane protein [Pedobacter cryoconitis]